MLRIGRRAGRQEPGSRERPGSPDASPIFGPVAVRDGSAVVLRRATDADAAGLRGFYIGLSASTLLRRFMTPTPRLPESSLSYLCDAGSLDREIVLATVGGEIVGEGRYHRVSGSADAEVALVVADAWQGRGLGTILSDRLARLARLRGVEAFTGTMLADNEAARRLLRASAPGAALRLRSGEIEFRIPLPDDQLRSAVREPSRPGPGPVARR